MNPQHSRFLDHKIIVALIRAYSHRTLARATDLQPADAR
jgi:hypothetical protein